MWKKMHIKFWLENPRGKDHLGDLGIDGTMLLKEILKKQGDNNSNQTELSQDRIKRQVQVP
jgi:hypothetical protein